MSQCAQLAAPGWAGRRLPDFTRGNRKATRADPSPRRARAQDGGLGRVLGVGAGIAQGRVAISNRRLIAADAKTVTFKVKD